MWGLFAIDFSQNTQRLHHVLFWKRQLLFVGNTVKGQISNKWWLQENKARKISWKVTLLETITGLERSTTWLCHSTIYQTGQSSPIAVT